MDIRLISKRGKHFKGIKDFSLMINGKNATVFGNNGTGKTTLNDEFRWLLFGKNSEDKTNFKLKPQDSDGNDIHNLQTEVEAEFIIDGHPLKLKKMQEEKWTRKRGSEESELTGNVVSYWVDEVPVKEGEYKQKISSIIDETIFKMITDPFFFSTKIKWEERRRIILEICGDVSDEEVFNSDVKLDKLRKALNGKNLDDYKKVVAERLSALKKERDDITPRIDENIRSLSFEQPDYSEVERSLAEYITIMNGIELEMIDSTKIASVFRAKQQELYGLKSKLDVAKTRIDTEATKEQRNWYSEKLKIESAINKVESDIKGFKSRIEANRKAEEADQADLISLREQHNTLTSRKIELTASQFVAPEEDSFMCHTCKQPLPSEDIEAKTLELFTNFETNKQKEIEKVLSDRVKNNDDGKELKAKIEQSKVIYDELLVKLEESEQQLKALEKELVKVGQEITKPVVQLVYTDDVEYATLQEQIATLQKELEAPVIDTTSSLISNKADVQAKIDECKNTLANKVDKVKIANRVEELKADEKRVSALISEFEGHKYLMEQFIISKVNLIESSINSRFKYVNFRLFEIQLNGGVNPCCDAMVNTNGSYVPFSEANLAGRMNAGIDIINSLSAYYGVTAPMFLDNRESVSAIIESPSQIINLVKPATWGELDKDTQMKLAGVDGEVTPADMYLIENAKKAWNDRNSVLRVEVQA